MPKPTARRAARPGVRHDGWTQKRRTKFLEVLARTASVKAAAEAAGKAKCTAYTLRRRDAEFAAAWDEALSSAMDELEAVAFERAMMGVEKIVVRGTGAPVTIREYSDRLLMFMLSRRRPESYAAMAMAAARGQPDERDIYAEVEARVHAMETERETGGHAAGGPEAKAAWDANDDIKSADGTNV